MGGAGRRRRQSSAAVAAVGGWPGRIQGQPGPRSESCWPPIRVMLALVTVQPGGLPVMAASAGAATGLRPYSRPADPSLDARLKSRPSDPSHVGALACCCQECPSPCLRSGPHYWISPRRRQTAGLAGTHQTKEPECACQCHLPAVRVAQTTATPSCLICLQEPDTHN